MEILDVKHILDSMKEGDCLRLKFKKEKLKKDAFIQAIYLAAMIDRGISVKPPEIEKILLDAPFNTTWDPALEAEIIVIPEKEGFDKDLFIRRLCSGIESLEKVRAKKRR